MCGCFKSIVTLSKSGVLHEYSEAMWTGTSKVLSLSLFVAFCEFCRKYFVAQKRSELKNDLPGCHASSYTADLPPLIGLPRLGGRPGWGGLCQRQRCGRVTYHQSFFLNRPLLLCEGVPIYVLSLEGADTHLGWLESRVSGCSVAYSIAVSHPFLAPVLVGRPGEGCQSPGCPNS